MSDTPEIETPPVPEIPAETAEKRQFMRTALRWVLIVLGILLVGGGLVYTLLYWPAYQHSLQLQSQVSQLTSDLDAANTQLSDAKTRVDSLIKNFEQTQSLLNSANARIALSALISDVSLARIAIMEKNWPAASQAFAQARANLSILPATAVPGETFSMLQERLEQAHKTYTADADASLLLLKDLYSNLLLVENSLK